MNPEVVAKVEQVKGRCQHAEMCGHRMWLSSLTDVAGEGKEKLTCKGTLIL